MLNLVATGHVQCLEHAGPGFGRLVRPRDHSRIADTAEAGIPWAADNDAFLGPREGRQGWKPERFALMLRRITDLPGCLFVTSPDVVADPEATRNRFEEWYEYLAETGHRIAYVLQDGEREDVVPWDLVGAVFIGGSTEYKLSGAAERLVSEAKERGKWVHMGRVNSHRRFDYARAIGVDSIDGQRWTKWRDQTLPDQLTWHEEPVQMRLPLHAD